MAARPWLTRLTGARMLPPEFDIVGVLWLIFLCGVALRALTTLTALITLFFL